MKWSVLFKNKEVRRIIFVLLFDMLSIEKRVFRKIVPEVDLEILETAVIPQPPTSII